VTNATMNTAPAREQANNYRLQITRLQRKKGIYMANFNKNNIVRSSLHLVLSGLLLITAPAQSQTPPAAPASSKLPAEAFYRTPGVNNIRLSPNGNYLVALKHVGSETAVMTVDLASNKSFYVTKKTSPVRLVDQIKIPILLIHGTDDASVPVEQSRIMAEELKEKGKIYEYIELKQGSHHLDYLPHRKQTFEAMEAFLKKYLPV
jgi:fermentation-respiration switch protein FrsA (DUF1100 family)